MDRPDDTTEPSAKRRTADLLLARLRRVTSAGAFVPEIDGLRFAAIAGVVLLHINTYTCAMTPEPFSRSAADAFLHSLFLRGAMGVQLFFAISGFVLMLPFARTRAEKGRRVSLKKYFRRRVTRLEPPYLINLAAIMVLLTVVNHQPISKLLPHLAASAFYLHNAIYSGTSLINGVAWSLEVEVQFYCAAPLIAMIYGVGRTAARRIAVAAGIMILVLAQGLVRQIPFWQGTLIGQMQFFLVGVLLADVYIFSWKEQPRRCLAWDAVSACAWASIALLPGEYMGCAPALVFLACVGAFRGRIAGRLFTNRWLVTIGGMCYTIYLYHYYVVSFVGKRTVGIRVSDYYPVNVGFQIALVGACVLAICSVMYLLTEKPFMYRDWPARAARFLTPGKRSSG